jgi:SAM-dependent methyltransferase
LGRKDLKIWVTSSSGAIAERLKNDSGSVLTEYFDGVAPGEFVNSVRCENLTCSSFAADSLDAVISEDVFEHIPHTQNALAEVWRVLKPGGVHAFTVPLDLSRKTECLFDVEGEEIILKKPIEWHGDPVRGAIAAYWRFGWDLANTLAEAGFEPSFIVPDFSETRKFGFANCITVVARKTNFAKGESLSAAFVLKQDIG